MDKRIFRVGYHGGNLYALVECDTPERAVEIAKAHRLRKFARSSRLGRPSKSVLADSYEPTIATDRDIAWFARAGIVTRTDMPVANDKRAASPRKRLSGTSGARGAETRPGSTFGETA